MSLVYTSIMSKPITIDFRWWHNDYWPTYTKIYFCRNENLAQREDQFLYIWLDGTNISKFCSLPRLVAQQQLSESENQQWVHTNLLISKHLHAEPGRLHQGNLHYSKGIKNTHTNTRLELVAAIKTCGCADPCRISTGTATVNAAQPGIERWSHKMLLRLAEVISREKQNLGKCFRRFAELSGRRADGGAAWARVRRAQETGRIAPAALQELQTWKYGRSARQLKSNTNDWDWKAEIVT